MGICGTAMGNAALLARAAGHEVLGADAGVYPPMSTVLVEAGIIDSTKVVRIALENAVSVASTLLLTEATMTEIPESQRERLSESDMAM